MDCNEGLRLLLEADIKFDWVITDVPYGINVSNMNFVKQSDVYVGSKHKVKRHNFKNTPPWDSVRISSESIDKMRRLSENQIIFGGNYYTDILPPTRSWVVWDKRLPDKRDRNDYADCELAWCNKGAARVFPYLYNGFLQGGKKDPRFHPTQKPTALWRMLLEFYTKEGDTVLDPYAGSQSLRVACLQTKRRYVGFEIHKEYFDKGEAWYSEEIGKIQEQQNHT